MRAGSELDETNIEAYAVNMILTRFFLRNEDSNLQPIRNGMTPIPGLFFHMEFPVRIDPGHVIVLTGPEGFSVTDLANTNCANFQWDPKETNYLGSSSTKHCKNNNIVFKVVDHTIPKDTPIKFRIDTANPSATPFIMKNFWSVYHYNTDVIGTNYATLPEPETLIKHSTTGAIQLLSSDAYKSWDILPQLMNVAAKLGTLTGANMAAGSRSDILFQFTPVSDANRVEITANSPAGFDFTLAEAPGQEIQNADGSKVRIRANIIGGTTVYIHLLNVLLGSTGEQTVFSIATFMNDKTMDEKLMFSDVFKLPGLISSYRDARLYSPYNLEPQLYPVKSGLQMRTDRPALIDFFIQLSNTAAAGSYLSVALVVYLCIFAF